MRFVACLVLASLLAGCGADGEPSSPGLKISGEGRFGVTTK